MRNSTDTALLVRLGRNRDISRRFHTTTQNVSRWKRRGITHPWRDYLSLVAFLDERHPGVIAEFEAQCDTPAEAA